MLGQPDIESSHNGWCDTLLDLDAVIASGWADLGDFPPEEYPKAETLYGSLRRHDQRLMRLRAAVAAEIEAWTGRVPLSVLTEEDFGVACRMLDEIDATMSEEERVAHTWVEHLLRCAGRLEDYAAWKLVTYRRFCPELNWVPILEKPAAGAD